jgi:hypothetical protein
MTGPAEIFGRSGKLLVVLASIVVLGFLGPDGTHDHIFVPSKTYQLIALTHPCIKFNENPFCGSRVFFFLICAVGLWVLRPLNWSIVPAPDDR